jgi:hypothetical protein
MSTCPNTGLSVPECSCVRCIEQQLERFAPAGSALARALHDPLVPREVRPAGALPPPVSERLTRPAL